MNRPISDQLAYGHMYWDAIAPSWWRLSDRTSQDVIGHMRLDLISDAYITVGHQHDYHKTRKREQKIFDTKEQARLWVEQFAKENWL